MQCHAPGEMREIKNLCKTMLHYRALMSGARTAMLKFGNMQAECRLWNIYNTIILKQYNTKYCKSKSCSQTRAQHVSTTHEGEGGT